MKLETIYAIASAKGKAGVSILRISGTNALFAFKLFSKIKLEPNKAKLISLYDSSSLKTIDKAICIYFKAPKSFTGEDIVEIHFHGSNAIQKLLFNVLEKSDLLRIAEPGEFSKQAFINNKMDLLQAEALIDLINSETEKQVSQAQKILEGSLSLIYNNWTSELTKTLAYLEAFTDFPEENIPKNKIENINKKIKKITMEIEEHLDDNHIGERMIDGINITILGNTNAGKSSLINFLSKKNTAIISKIHGTTRDIIEAKLDIDGFPVNIFDTAGIRKTNDEIEKIGIKIAKDNAKKADIIILIIDVLEYENSEHIRKYVKKLKKPTIFAYNKIDKNKNFKINDKNSIYISIKNNINTDLLIEKIREEIKISFSNEESINITRARHRESLIETLKSLHNITNFNILELVAEDLRIAIRYLGKITGSVDVEDLLDIIFQDFCIGK